MGEFEDRGRIYGFPIAGGAAGGAALRSPEFDQKCVCNRALTVTPPNSSRLAPMDQRLLI